MPVPTNNSVLVGGQGLASYPQRAFEALAELTDSSGPGNLTWDAHNNVEENHKRMAGESDKPVSGLLKDLRRRGLLDQTLVIWGRRVRPHADVPRQVRA